MGKRRKCRLWWPSNLTSQTLEGSKLLLFGWFISSFESSSSFDVVVAFACDESTLSSTINHYSDLRGILRKINMKMPALLQDKCELSLLGNLEAEFGINSQLFGCENDANRYAYLANDREKLDTYAGDQRNWKCGCTKLEGFVQQGSSVAPEIMWIKLFYISKVVGRKVCALPRFGHIHLDRETIRHLHLHVIVYETPAFGVHHYSAGPHRSFNSEISPLKKPRWFEDLHKNDIHFDLNTIIQAMNSAKASYAVFDDYHLSKSFSAFHIVFIFNTLAWKIFAVSAASLSATIYTVLQSSHILFSWVSSTHLYLLLERVFSYTWQNVYFRCCQFLYWPIFLHNQSTRSQSCVEFAETVVHTKHMLWSNILVDVLLGNLLGMALWHRAEPASLWVLNFARSFTDNWLRTGCVWLMGNPAGFKLNTELAGILGMFSLNAVQIWSTMWIFFGPFFVHLTKGVALSGIFFGLTTLAALLVDVTYLATMHILALHSFLSLLYSAQLQATTALWRLFRGQKMNPLRHRLDSYDHTVEQHVVGSLLFTPILLLLPTTSAFYIFFTILYTAVRFMCVVVLGLISFIHSTPFAKVFLWLRSRKRFPSGIWVEIVSYQQCESEATDNSSAHSSSSKSCTLISCLHSNYLTLGEVVRPHYSRFYSIFSKSAISSSAYRLLTGKGIDHMPGISLPLNLPWMAINVKEYWLLCYNSVYACRKNAL